MAAAAGISVECLLIGYGMTLGELDDFAESCGLKVLRKQPTEPEEANG
jgi:hypothetical protein